MAGPPPPSPRDAQSQPEPDSDPASVTRTAGGRRKRARSNNDDPPLAACDQCRVRKVRCDRGTPSCGNCKKSGVECSSNLSGKRVNHTKQLRDDFSVVLTRLDHVDTTLAALTSFIQQVAARPVCSSHANSQFSSHANDPVPLPTPVLLDLDQPDTPESADNPTSENPPFDTCESDEAANAFTDTQHHLPCYARQPVPLLESDEHGECHGHGGGETPFITFALQDPHVRATLQRKVDEFPFRSRRPEAAVVGDLKPITTPPRLLCNLFIEGYLQHINPRTPIFDDAELHSAIEAHYREEHPKEDSAWALIINNVVLLELGLEIQATRAPHSHSRGMNDDILPSFLRNCDRAIGNLNTFMVPNLANVQALMTLTLVAREFYSHNTAQRVCQAACQAGRTFGLHRSKAQLWGEGSNSAESDTVRQPCIYDRSPCDLHMFDSDHRPFSDAFGQLANFWKEIYLKLYTSRAARASAETRARQVQQLSSSLDKYAQRHAESIPSSPSSSAGDTDPIKLELAYGFLVSQVLVLRCDRRNEKSQERMRALARKSLRLVLAVCKPPRTTPRLALLSSIVGNYPMVAFFELASYRLAVLFKTGEAGAGAQADITLLRAVCEHLQIPEHDKLTHIFYTRLKLGLEWARDLLEVLGEALASTQDKRHGEDYQQRSRASSTCHSKHSPIPTIPELLNVCPIRLPKMDPAHSSLPPSRPGETADFGAAELAERTGFGFFTPMGGTDPVDLNSRPLSADCDFAPPATCSMAPSQSELASDFMTGSSDWSNFNIDYFQETFGQGATWA
ncbi:C6 transcription factor [Apiospora phragmitis]|uniref:C6 transcription factor n=1 Tax=Apiospora phragmitis TaxID=2905665 RepID=A0ABR1U6N6_9PEZI